MNLGPEQQIHGFAQRCRRWTMRYVVAGLPVALAVILTITLAGCFSSRDSDARCNDVSEYQASKSVPGIVIPDNLKSPAESSSFTIPASPAGATSPDSQSAAQAPVPGAACLARPPDYFRKEAAPAGK